jgi:hypothetical protein
MNARERNEAEPCRSCGEAIQVGAKKCRHCGVFFVAGGVRSSPPERVGLGLHPLVQLAGVPIGLAVSFVLTHLFALLADPFRGREVGVDISGLFARPIHQWDFDMNLLAALAVTVCGCWLASAVGKRWTGFSISLALSCAVLCPAAFLG